LRLYKNLLLTIFISLNLFISSSVLSKSTDEAEELNTNNIILNENNYPVNKTIIKSVEHVVMHSYNGNRKIKARIDTGATQSSIDLNLAKELGYNTHLGQINVVSANGIKTRPLVEISYELSGKKIKSIFSLADRRNLNYSILIGRNDLEGFLIDPSDN